MALLQSTGITKMATNIITKGKVERKYNGAVMGSNKLTYNPYTSNLAANTVSYYDGKLRQSSVVHINYDLNGKFPEEEFAEALTPSSTEYTQASGREVEFSYHRQPVHVEFTLSNMQEVNDVNINAGILNRMLMQYDREHFLGKFGNAGMFNNKNSIEHDSSKPIPVNNLSELIALIDVLYNEMSTYYGIRESEYPSITLSYSSDVASIIRKPITTSSDNVVTGKSVVNETYKGMTHEEVPTIIGAGSHVSLTYRPAINNHRSALPGIYSHANGDAHGLTKKTLFTYESAANEVEGKGGYVFQRTETPASKSLKASLAKKHKQ